MTIVVGAHGRTADLEFIVLCTDSRGTIPDKQPITAQKIFRAGDYFVAGTGNLHLVQMAADYADRVSISPPSTAQVIEHVITPLNSYVWNMLTPEQRDASKTNIVIAGPKRDKMGFATEGLGLYCIGWEHILNGEAPKSVPHNYVLEGSGRLAVEQEVRQRQESSKAPAQIQDVVEAFLDVYHKAIVAARDPGVDWNLQFALQTFSRCTFSKHLLLPSELLGDYPLTGAEDYLKLFIGKRFSDKGIETQDNFKTEANLMISFYEMLMNQLAAIILRRQDPALFLGVHAAPKYEEVMRQASETITALASGNLPIIRETVNAGKGVWISRNSSKPF